MCNTENDLLEMTLSAIKEAARAIDPCATICAYGFNGSDVTSCRIYPRSAQDAFVNALKVVYGADDVLEGVRDAFVAALKESEGEAVLEQHAERGFCVEVFMKGPNYETRKGHLEALLNHFALEEQDLSSDRGDSGIAPKAA